MMRGVALAILFVGLDRFFEGCKFTDPVHSLIGVVVELSLFFASLYCVAMGW